jgi:hypothetical protein
VRSAVFGAQSFGLEFPEVVAAVTTGDMISEQLACGLLAPQRCHRYAECSSSLTDAYESLYWLDRVERS